MLHVFLAFKAEPFGLQYEDVYLMKMIEGFGVWGYEC
jgi:hypothetical protein